MLSRSILRHIFAFFGKRTKKKFRVTFTRGPAYTNFSGGAADIHIIFKNRRAEWRSLLFFYHGLIEAYIEGDVDIIAEKPLQTFAGMGREVLAEKNGLNEKTLVFLNPIALVRVLLQEWRQDNYTRSQAKKNAEFHYGLDPRFFELMLEKTVGYSEGYWTENTKTLDQAKVNNYEYICRKLRLKPGDKVVEVGAGWGFLPIYMVKNYGVSVTVYNPVRRQNEYMRERFLQHGVSDKITLVEGDHRDISQHKWKFDKYVSIGVYEHAGYRKRQYHSWLNSISDALKPGGLGLISTTTFMDRGMTEFLTLKYIFPGGHIPSLPLTLKTMDECGLSLVEVENLWMHYQKTVAVWCDNVYKNWPEMHAIDPAVFDESFRRKWLMYLDGTVDMFAKGMDLSHILFTKGRGPDLYPWVRDEFHKKSRFVEGDSKPECFELSR
ncbi:hypothetical protein A3A40_00190 [Candidatus Kaiserbacteria bacterium RIFCSPLOWO2_01_FULL_54_20]|uniref:Cyclopropane-fatty-acyl-phospholipid synthase n=1 Tax=Candidatus Kaiserbacteria bacterium RIFCSPLOWO2_01_FULL_54_20 TaxID=1798513 RepID=A0A1F6EKP3_9BACT|nr:MAG: hypothetical protein A3A40_00190 [Candidatus Kaiserbacteria bacterium RIFCSPLOWO2_01_FULL_54_20]